MWAADLSRDAAILTAGAPLIPLVFISRQRIARLHEEVLDGAVEGQPIEKFALTEVDEVRHRLWCRFRVKGDDHHLLRRAEGDIHDGQLVNGIRCPLGRIIRTRREHRRWSEIATLASTTRGDASTWCHSAAGDLRDAIDRAHRQASTSGAASIPRLLCCLEHGSLSLLSELIEFRL